MASTIGWMELSASALRRLRQELEPESDGVRDEMGVGAIHSGYADHFFPGTSVQQKRPRYVLFTCWNYLCLSRLDPSEPSPARKDQAEDWVRQQLLKAGQKNVIGERVERPAQPVDYVYWTALRTWGFYRGPDRSTLLHRWDSIRPRRIWKGHDEEPERVADEVRAAFFVKEPPHYWLSPRPRHDITFTLEEDEARFLKARLESLRPCVLSAAASIAATAAPRADALWEDELIAEAAQMRREEPMVERARLASSMALLVRAMYAALVERRRNETVTRSDLVRIGDPDHYRADLHGVIGATSVREDVRRLELTLLAKDLPDLSEHLLSLLRYVQERVGRVRRPADADRLLLDDETLRVFSSEEVRRKGERRARLPDTALGAERRAAFTETTLEVAGLGYRWANVRMLLRDLHDGLRRRAA